MSEALMFPTYEAPDRFLAADDASGIQTLYGTAAKMSQPRCGFPTS
jgi:hypothetical protein